VNAFSAALSSFSLCDSESQWCVEGRTLFPSDQLKNQPHISLSFPLYVDIHTIRQIFLLSFSYLKIFERDDAVEISMASPILSDSASLRSRALHCFEVLLRKRFFRLCLEICVSFGLKEEMVKTFQALSLTCLYYYSHSVSFNSFIDTSCFEASIRYGIWHRSWEEEEEEEEKRPLSALSSDYWVLLHDLLLAYDGAHTNYIYHSTAIETLLHADCRFEVPLWLSVKLKEGNPSLLLSLYLRYNHFEDACALCCYLFQKSIEEMEGAPVGVCVVYVPFKLILLFEKKLEFFLKDAKNDNIEDEEEMEMEMEAMGDEEEGDEGEGMQLILERKARRILMRLRKEMRWYLEKVEERGKMIDGGR
jgi:hypothetical protein